VVWNDVESMIQVYAMTPIAEKRALPFVCLCNQGEEKTVHENMQQLFVDHLLYIPFVYNEEKVLRCNEINETWR
jgi:hypothetical protein